MLTARRRWLDAVDSESGRPGVTAFDGVGATAAAAHTGRAGLHRAASSASSSPSSSAAPRRRRRSAGTPAAAGPTRTVATTAAFASLSMGAAPAKPAVIISDLASAGGGAGDQATGAPQWRVILGNLAAGATAGAAVEAGAWCQRCCRCVGRRGGRGGGAPSRGGGGAGEASTSPDPFFSPFPF